MLSSISKHQWPIPSSVSFSESAALYMTHTIRHLATSLIGIFLPIFIFTLEGKFMFHDDVVINGIIWIFYYYMLRSATFIVFLTTITNFVFTRLHLLKSILISIIFLALNIVCWFLAQYHPAFLFLGAVLSGCNAFFYWLPYHIFFVRKSQEKNGHFGKNVELRDFLLKIAGAIGPVLGGITIMMAGFGFLFTASVLILFLAIIPLLVSLHEHKHAPHDTKKIMNNYLLNPAYKKISFALAGASMESLILGTLWPVLLFIVLANFEKIGFLSSASVFLSALTALFVGRLVDRVSMKKVHLVGVVINSLMYVPRLLFSTPWVLYSVDILDKLNGSAYSIPLVSQTYEKAKRLGESDFIIYREMVVHTTLAVSSCLIIVVFTLFTFNWRYLFVLGTIASMATYLMSMDDH